MKKTRINLLTSKQDYYRIEGYFGLFRRFLVGYCVVVFMIIAALAGYQVTQTLQINNLISRKADIQSQLASRKTDEVKLITLSKKLNSYHEFIKDDARFIPYYELLLQTLQQSSQSATLTEFNIDKSRKMDFKLIFQDFDEMVRAFQFIESSEFGTNFEQLDLINFIGRAEDFTNKSISYELSFDGKFKQIDEAKN